MLNILNKFLKHLISLAFALFFLGTAILFIYVFSGIFSAEGKGIVRVGILDTGLDLSDERFKSVLCSTGHRDFTGEGLLDKNGHGTHVAGLIKQYAGDSGYCLVIIKYYSDKASGTDNASFYLYALRYISQSGLDFVNYSGGGDSPGKNEQKMIYSSYPTVFIVSAGNYNEDLLEHPYYPAYYSGPNMVVVGASEANGLKASFSNYGVLVKTWELGVNVMSTWINGGYKEASGTSVATAIHTGKMVKAKVSK